MSGNTQVFKELPKPNFNTTKDASTGETIKDDMFVKTFKEAVEGGMKIASADMQKP